VGSVTTGVLVVNLGTVPVVWWCFGITAAASLPSVVFFRVLRCGEAERCPIFPGVTKRLHWSFPDPSALQGAHEEKMVEVRKVRDTIRAKIEAWGEELCAVAV
jgi:hypothetical protein